MRSSRSSAYGLLATGYIAQHTDQKNISSETISKEYNIPLEYLLKILQQLVRADVLRGKRGPHGGYSLTRPLNKINLLEIIEAIDGPIQSCLYLTEFAPKEKFCIKAGKAHEKAIADARKVLKNKKLSDLI